MHARKLTKLLAAATLAVGAFGAAPLAQAGLGIPQGPANAAAVAQSHASDAGLLHGHFDGPVGDIIAI